MTAAVKAVALQHLGEYAEAFPPEFVIADGELVTVVTRELRGAADDEFYVFHTVRVRDGRVVEEWSNSAPGSAPIGSGRPDPGHVPVPLGDGDVSRTTVTVTEFYRRVFDAHDAGAVADLVAEDYVQHAKHVPPGRAGLERFVRELFPDGPIPAPESPDTEPVILMGEGDRVVIAAGIPQPDGSGGTFIRYLFDAYRVTDGRLAEHWSGIDADNRPVH